MPVKRALGFTLGPIVWFILLALIQSPGGLWVQWPHGLSGSAERWPPASAPLSLRPGSHQEQAGVPVPLGTVWRRPRGRPWTRENVCWLECVMMRTGRKNLVFKGFLCVVVHPELLQSCIVETLFVCEAADTLIGADDSRRSLLTER